MKTHVSLNVGNVEESIRFYSKMFGIEPFKLKTDYAKFDVTNPPLNLTMNQINYAKRRLAFASRFAGRDDQRSFRDDKALERKRFANFGRNADRLVLRDAG